MLIFIWLQYSIFSQFHSLLQPLMCQRSLVKAALLLSYVVFPVLPFPGGNPPSAPSSSTSNQPGSMNVPGSLPSSSPYTMPPEPTLSQNPLSIMMSRMSKFAMPSSTPLYHDAIKTVASSDDDSPPARSPNLPSMNNSMSGKCALE